MQYHSTRGNSPIVDSARAVLLGLAEDGGLFLPESIPEFDWQACVASDTLTMATQILTAFLPDIPEMEELVRKAYVGNRSAPRGNEGRGMQSRRFHHCGSPCP